MSFKVKLRVFICNYFISVFLQYNDLQTRQLPPSSFTRECSELQAGPKRPAGPPSRRCDWRAEDLPRTRQGRCWLPHSCPPSRKPWEPPQQDGALEALSTGSSSPHRAWDATYTQLGAPQCASWGTVGMNRVMVTKHTRFPDKRQPRPASITTVTACRRAAC